MRIPLLAHTFARTLAVLLALALVAAACSDDPAAEELVDDLLSDDGGDDGDPDPTGTDDPPDEPVDVPPGPVTIPEADAPDPDDTPLPVDRDYRIITLDNGLTVMLRSNDSPGGSLHLRLVVNAGSVQQPVGNDGSAHFLEHMLFNGTEQFPANELTAQLQRLGISFGADVNAYTSYDETVYFLGASLFDPQAPEIALDVLAEWADKATIDPSQVDSEIGVVRDELRQGRESVDGIVFTRFEEIYTAGTDYEGHIVVGDPTLVEATTADTLRAFYDAWYRPDNMAVIVVGDLSLDRLEEEVRERFEGLTARGNSPTRADVEVALSPEPVTDVITHPDNANDNLSYDIPLPVWDLDTVGGERMALIERAVALMLGTRLEEAFQRGEIDADFEPFLDTFAINRGLRYYGTNLQGPDLAVLLDQFQSQLLTAALTGFSEDDVARARAQLVAGLDDELATLESTQDAQFATELMVAFLEGGSLDDADNRIRRQRDVVESLTAEELTDFWRWILGASGPIVIAVAADEASVPTADELRTILEDAQPAAAAGETESIDELMDRPDPAEIVDEDVIRTLNGDVTVWTFANGAQVAHQETQISAGQFSVWMESDGGWSTLDDPDASIAAAAVNAIAQSGVGPHDPSTLARYLEPLDLGVSFAIEDIYEGAYGSAATSDAEELFALIHLTMTEPRIDDVALRSVGRQGETALEFLATNPDVQANERLIALASDEDPRVSTFLTQSEIDALDADQLLDVFMARFGTVDDLGVSIVGDIDAAAARDLATRYVGTLPAGAADQWVDLGIEAPTGAAYDEIELNDGTANGGITRFDFVEGRFDAETQVAATLLSTIITNRITDVIREELGASYGGNASLFVEHGGPGGVGSFIQVDGDPARLEEIDAALDAMLLELATTGPTTDEFERAFTVLENEYSFVNNGLFLDVNLNRVRFPDADILLPDDQFDILFSTTPTDVRLLAESLYADAASVEVRRVLA
ncbi:MAG: insulinase family protein [Acidimicrobiales bacterium]|nr:insulinase family protein [Acidimicrobiales bacterium]